MALSEQNKLNQKFFEVLSTRWDIMLTQTVLPCDESSEGIYCIRLAGGGAKTTEETVMNAWKTIEEVGQKVLESGSS